MLTIDEYNQKIQYIKNDSGCWLLTSHSRKVNKHPKMRVNNKQIGINRITYELFVGPLAASQRVENSCGNKACVNPEHLRIWQPLPPRPYIKKGWPPPQVIESPESFQKYVKYEVIDGDCWEPLTPGRKGEYWHISSRGVCTSAHRLSYVAHIGPIEEGRLVCHRCDNPSCVNPEHLFIGTHKDNSNDMVNKNRVARAGHKKKLTTQDVKNIIDSGLGSSRLSKVYNVSASHIRRIRRRERWTDIDGTEDEYVVRGGAPWRCRACGHINEPTDNTCATCS